MGVLSVITTPAKTIGGKVMISLDGIIDDSVDLAELIGSVPPSCDVEVDCEAISRINSLGIQEWIRYFGRLQANGARLHFVECSPAILAPFSDILNFACGGTVESVNLPYRCAACHHSFRMPCTTEKLLTIRQALPVFACESCGTGTATFDDIPEELLRFLDRRTKA
jgi:anti-anti-sigma regulatory factor/DNA-directed RNA polymerase subunit RPC12/RpoP